MTTSHCGHETLEAEEISPPPKHRTSWVVFVKGTAGDILDPSSETVMSHLSTTWTKDGHIVLPRLLRREILGQRHGGKVVKGYAVNGRVTYTVLMGQISEVRLQKALQKVMIKCSSTPKYYPYPLSTTRFRLRSLRKASIMLKNQTYKPHRLDVGEVPRPVRGFWQGSPV